MTQKPSLQLSVCTERNQNIESVVNGNDTNSDNSETNYPIRVVCVRKQDPRVSSLGSRGMTNQTLTTQHSQPTMAADTQSVHREESNMSSMTELVVRDLQDALSKLKDEKK
ncbi:uncharacterized protein LOC102810276 [Saccoglossus kowalevskii]